MKKYKKPVIITGIILLLLVIIYFIGVIYFSNHFFYGTKINGTDFSMESVERVKDNFKGKTGDYVLTIVQRGGATEKLEGRDFDVKYNYSAEIDRLKNKQNKMAWPLMFFKTEDYKAEHAVEYNSDKLTELVGKLECMNDEKMVQPQDAYPEFDGESFKIISEVYGTYADKDVIISSVKNAVDQSLTELKLEETKCYQNPAVLKDDPALISLCDTLNSYLGASITYDMISHQDVVDKELISQWLSWDEEYNVVLDEDAIWEYMSEFGNTYDTIGSTRSFTTAGGYAAQVSGGTFGWEIDEATEGQALIDSIKAGEVVVREPAYVQRGATHGAQDWGSSYIEVSLGSQYMWCVVNDEVVLESAVVTGKPQEHSTPEGVYTILSMGRDVTLVGNIVPETGQPEYRTPVAYWMQVTSGGVGFHDATWQPTFGGSWYLEHGSHGCINMPLAAAESLYGLIYNGMPVVMHY